MKALVEVVGASGRNARFVEQPDVSEDDAEEYGPLALSNRGNAHVFASCEEAGRWVDENSQYGDFVIHGVRS